MPSIQYISGQQRHLIFLIPVTVCCCFAVDFLAAGRVGGRYVLSVAGMESALGLMALIGMVEMKYRSGLSLEFWNVFSCSVIALRRQGFGGHPSPAPFHSAYFLQAKKIYG